MQSHGFHPSSHGLSLRHYGASRGSHAHDHFQVLVGLEGVLELDVEGHGRRIGAGDGWVVTPGDKHDFESRDGSRCLVLDTTHALWAQCAAHSPLAPQALPLARYLALCLAQPSPPPMALHHGAALLLEAWGTSVPSGRGRTIDWPSLAAWAQAHWHRPLSVADLAAKANLSASQFAQRCRDEQGVSVMHWLRTQRLLYARQLRESGTSVAETARRAGYRSPSALTAAMRRLTVPD